MLKTRTQISRQEACFTGSTWSTATTTRGPATRQVFLPRVSCRSSRSTKLRLGLKNTATQLIPCSLLTMLPRISRQSIRRPRRRIPIMPYNKSVQLKAKVRVTRVNPPKQGLRQGTEGLKRVAHWLLDPCPRLPREQLNPLFHESEPNLFRDQFLRTTKK